ncbi:hypothetical protein ACFSYD_02725 [Paracoccus aerius]
MGRPEILEALPVDAVVAAFFDHKLGLRRSASNAAKATVVWKIAFTFSPSICPQPLCEPWLQWSPD